MSTATVPQGEAYNGTSGGLKKPSDWLASEDIPLGKEVPVEIEDVRLFKNVKFEGGRTEPKVAALKFVGREKMMILNATNRKRLVKMFTSDTTQWRKQTVRIYVDTKVKFAGELVNGLRIKLVE